MKAFQYRIRDPASAAAGTVRVNFDDHKPARECSPSSKFFFPFVLWWFFYYRNLSPGSLERIIPEKFHSSCSFAGGLHSSPWDAMGKATYPL